MSDVKERWRRLYEAFDPQSPPRDPAWRAERPYSPAEDILTSLQDAPAPKKVLFKGTSGNGKTTELLHVVAGAHRTRFVIYFDFEQHFRTTMRDDAALQSAQPWELLFLAGVAIWAAGRRAGVEWSAAQEEQLRQAAAALLARDPKDPPRIDLAGIAAAMSLVLAGVASNAAGAAAGLAALAPGLNRLASSAQWQVPFQLGRREILADQDPLVTRLLHAVDGLVLHVQTVHRPVLLALDGLDRLGGDAARRLFVESSLLSGLSCNLVLTCPLEVSSTRARFDTVKTLANVPVLDEAAPPSPGPGVGFFREMWRRRAGDLADALSVELQDRLAWASGGLPRHFCRLVRDVAEWGYRRGADSVPGEVVEAVLDQHRRDLEDGMTREEFHLLRAVMDDPDHARPAGSLADDLLAEHRLVPYPDGSTWYYPHPLLTLRRLRPAPSTGSAAS